MKGFDIGDEMYVCIGDFKRKKIDNCECKLINLFYNVDKYEYCDEVLVFKVKNKLWLSEKRFDKLFNE